MQFAQKTLAIVLSLVFMVGSAGAQQSHVVDPGSIDRALAGRAEDTAAKHQSIRTALQQREVRRIADRVGLDIARAEAASATLDGAELDQLAAQARLVNEAIAGGQTVTLNLLWVIIGLLILLIILVAD